MLSQRLKAALQLGRGPQNSPSASFTSTFPTSSERPSRVTALLQDGSSELRHVVETLVPTLSVCRAVPWAPANLSAMSTWDRTCSVSQKPWD